MPPTTPGDPGFDPAEFDRIGACIASVWSCRNDRRPRIGHSPTRKSMRTIRSPPAPASPTCPRDCFARSEHDHDRFARRGPARGPRRLPPGDLRPGHDGVVRRDRLRNPGARHPGSSRSIAPDRGGRRGRPGLRRPQDRDRPGCRGRAVDVGLGDQGVADGRRADQQPRDRRRRLDGHLERAGLVAVVRRLPRAGPGRLRDRPGTRGSSSSRR